MKRTAIVLLILALLMPAFALAEAPPPGALVFEGQMSAALFLPDGRVVYVPVNKEGDNYLPQTEIRCVDAAGNLQWRCELPPGKVWWGGPQALPDGSFGLVMAEGDWRQGVLHLVSADGKLLRSQKMPAGFRPLMLAGEWVYGSNEEYELYAIDFKGQVSPHPLPALGDKAIVLWCASRDEGRFLAARGQLSGEEDFTKRQSDQVLLHLDAAGAYTHQAVLRRQRVVEGFGSDAVLSPQGGITALAHHSGPEDEHNAFSLISFDDKGEIVWQKSYAPGGFWRPGQPDRPEPGRQLYHLGHGQDDGDGQLRLCVPSGCGWGGQSPGDQRQKKPWRPDGALPGGQGLCERSLGAPVVGRPL